MLFVTVIYKVYSVTNREGVLLVVPYEVLPRIGVESPMVNALSLFVVSVASEHVEDRTSPLANRYGSLCRGEAHSRSNHSACYVLTFALGFVTHSNRATNCPSGCGPRRMLVIKDPGLKTLRDT
jgi:hypothetical protein